MATSVEAGQKVGGRELSANASVVWSKAVDHGDLADASSTETDSSAGDGVAVSI